MEIRRARLAICAMLALAIWNSAVPLGHAQRYGAPKPKPRIYWVDEDGADPAQNEENSSKAKNNNSQNTATQKQRVNPNARTAQSTNQQRQQPRQMTSQQRSGGSGKQQPIRTATRTQAASGSKPKPDPVPTSMEKLEGEKRVAFMKLIGANWIWSPAYAKDKVPVGDCYFRKTFQISQAEIAQVHIACDNEYELYVNGRLAGRGADWRKMDVHDVQKFLVRGTNVLAIKATNTDAGPAGLVARVVVKERGGTFESFSTDRSWRTSVKAQPDWSQARARDTDWLPAKVYGPLGSVLPWGDEVVIADEGSRFVIDPEFNVERVVTDEQAGSIIAMTFNADGDLLVSREGGGILLVRDKNHDGTFESVEPFCTDVKNIQGILSLGKRVYAIGDGPAGGALYKLTDADADGRAESVTPVIKFHGAIGEHGPHKVHLGPDGLLYVLCGNFAQASASFDPHSAYAKPYEGDLVQPRYEDPQGHAAGILAPGGTILRTDQNGTFVELVAGGFRNPYDFALTNDGELFTADADMEWDIGAPWYRPTRLIHVTSGGEFGWRSGWSPWPAYYIDSLPGTVDTGPGSPTGVAFYSHNAFPPRLQNTLFVGDWALGHINAVKLERDGASYTAKVTPFLKGRPLNVTSLEVGPDGALYFATGGRGTDGGVYRIRWTGSAPSKSIRFGQGIEAALDQPQLDSDWARTRIAKVKANLGDRWQIELERVLTDKRNTSSDRLRALDLMTYFGPVPTTALLTQLSHDDDAAMRMRVVRLMGVRSESELDRPLVACLSDRDPWIRRTACESVSHRGTGAPVAKLTQLLGDKDRYVAFAARRALEKIPPDEWQDRVLSAKSRAFLQGSTALLSAYPSPEVARKILARCEAMLRGEVTEPGQKPGALSDATYMDTLRVVQLALLRGKLKPAGQQALAQQIIRDYPMPDPMINRELVKLLAYLQPPGAAHALAHQLETNIPDTEKLQVAAYAPRITAGWETHDKLIMLNYLEHVRGIEGGHSLTGYVEYFARDFFAAFSLAERQELITTGEKYPICTLSVLAKLPENPGAEVLSEIRALDKRLEGVAGEPVARLRVGIVAVLGASGEPDSMAYLRELYLHQPERRAAVAMSLTQHPEADNWPILVDSLRTVDGDTAHEILTALLKVDRQPEKSEPYRNTILLGLRMQANGDDLAVRLIEKWVGTGAYQPGAPIGAQLAAWQAWYATTFPNERPAELPKESQQNKWSYEELLSFLDSPDGKAGSRTRGAQVFHDAQCISCHRFNGNGERIGPDLTAVAQRFTRKEILESIVYPNQVVSDQYASKMVSAGGKTYTGIAVRNPDGGMTVLQTDGTKVELAAADIEDVQPTKVSAMPEGLANRLSLEQIADLFAFLINTPESVASRKTPAAR